jgi:F-type H+-transporting ATPase subunit a
MSSALHISISAETVAHIGPLAVSNSMLTSIIVSFFIVGFAALVHSKLTNTGKPGRLQAFAEMVIEALYQLCHDITGSTMKSMKFAPLVISFFFFIIFNNWAGLIPGVGSIGFREGEEREVAIVPQAHASTPKEVVKTETIEKTEAVTEVKAAEETTTESEHKEKGVFVPYFRAGTADLNTTLALAIISVVMTQVFGFSFLGIKYTRKYLDLSSPIMFFVGVLETILEFAKVISFAFRLFGNIFAGEVLLAVMTMLVPLVIPMPFYGMELFVGVIQALVFAMLSLVFFNLATLGHGEEHEEGH